MGAVIVLTILATLVCGGGVYTAFSGKLDDGVSAIMLLCSAMVTHTRTVMRCSR